MSSRRRPLTFAPFVAVAALALGTGTARADEKAACIAAFDAGQTLSAAGKLTAALAQFAACSREVCPRSLQKACVEQASQSTALLPTVVLSATDAAHNDVSDVTVRIDDVVVTGTLDGKALPVDPGVHTFRFEKAGLPPVERRAVVKEGQKGQSIAVVLAPTPSVAGPVTPVLVVPDEPAHGMSTGRYAGIGVGAVGVAGLVVGGIFGSMAFAKWSDAQTQAKSAATFGQAGSTESTGKTDATVSTVAFVAGGVLAAAGITLYVVSPAKGGPSATVAPMLGRLGGLSVSGAF